MAGGKIPAPPPPFCMKSWGGGGGGGELEVISVCCCQGCCDCINETVVIIKLLYIWSMIQLQSLSEDEDKWFW